MDPSEAHLYAGPSQSPGCPGSYQSFRRQQNHTLSFNPARNQNLERNEPPPTSNSLLNMSASEEPIGSEGISLASQHVWSTATSEPVRQQSAMAHEGFSSCMEEILNGLPRWESSTLSIQNANDIAVSRSMSMHQDLYPAATTVKGSESPSHNSDDVYRANNDYRRLDATEALRR